MYCNTCGNELVGNASYCSVCGAPVSGDASQSQADRQRQTPLPSQQRRSYEYARTTVKSDLAQATLDCYESLGYELTGQKVSAPSGQTTLSFRRNRRVSNKAQLAKMQRAMDDTISSIEHLEEQKTKKATGQAMTLGIISALILGVGMCCTMVWTNLMTIGVIVGIIGIVGCIFAWLRYRKTYENETARLNPKIEEAYDRLATQCEEAQTLLFA